MDYMSIIASTIAASDNRNAVLKTVESNLKNLQKTVDTAG